MRWGDLDHTTKSALALSAALIGLGMLAAWLSLTCAAAPTATSIA